MGKIGPPKGNVYRSGITIFPDADNPLDREMCDYLRALLMREAQRMGRPTRTSLANHLGILRERMGRLAKTLDLEREIFG